MINQTSSTDQKPISVKIKPLPYPLNILKYYLKDYIPPKKSFDPNGKWENKYKMFSLASGRAGHAGTLIFKRKLLSKSEAFIELNFDKAGINRNWQKVNAKMKFKTDLLSSPVKWQYEAKMTNPKGGVIKNTEIKEYAINDNNEINFVWNDKRKKIITSRNIALNWLLFDAVQRMPRKDFGGTAFTLIDHFDQPKPNNKITFRDEIEINVAKGEILKLFTYKQLGTGILPIVYYVDKYGRLLFVVSGIEAYGLVNS
ncbi:MAG: hypothetical protein DRI44_08870 [Chlamydiae bacterium]|nr:MAG: hypothetical protein DRI44_08870 [Chlamydiota bacterium]